MAETVKSLTEKLAASNEVNKKLQEEIKTMKSVVEEASEAKIAELTRIGGLAALDAQAKLENRRSNFVSKIYVVNPYTDKVFQPEEITYDVLVDSWVIGNVHAGILKEVPKEEAK